MDLPIHRPRTHERQNEVVESGLFMQWSCPGVSLEKGRRILPEMGDDVKGFTRVRVREPPGSSDQSLRLGVLSVKLQTQLKVFVIPSSFCLQPSHEQVIHQELLGPPEAKLLFNPRFQAQTMVLLTRSCQVGSE